MLLFPFGSRVKSSRYFAGVQKQSLNCEYRCNIWSPASGPGQARSHAYARSFVKKRIGLVVLLLASCGWVPFALSSLRACAADARRHHRYRHGQDRWRSAGHSGNDRRRPDQTHTQPEDQHEWQLRLCEPAHRHLYNYLHAQRFSNAESALDNGSGRSYRDSQRNTPDRPGGNRRRSAGRSADERRRHHQWLHSREKPDRFRSSAHRKFHRLGDSLAGRKCRVTQRNRRKRRFRESAHLGQRPARHQQHVSSERSRCQQSFQRQKHQPGRLGAHRKQHGRAGASSTTAEIIQSTASPYWLSAKLYLLPPQRRCRSFA